MTQWWERFVAWVYRRDVAFFLIALVVVAVLTAAGL